MKKLTKAMYGKSMMKKGGMKKMADGGGVGRSQASGGKGSPSDMTPNSSSGPVNGPNTVYAPGKKKTGDSTKSYKTGGMVNSNTKVIASKIAKGRSGGTSKAPKKAIPKAMYGASMDPNMMKPGMMKMGGSKKK
jgi:hypothetical protein